MRRGRGDKNEGRAIFGCLQMSVGDARNERPEAIDASCLKWRERTGWREEQAKTSGMTNLARRAKTLLQAVFWVWRVRLLARTSGIHY